MRKEFLPGIFSITLVLLAIFMNGCIGGDEEEETIGTGETSGIGMIASLKTGSWAEYTLSDGGKGKNKFFGEDTWQGRKCIVMEYESLPPGGSHTIMQTWLDKSTGQLVVMFLKEDGVVSRFDPTGTGIPNQEIPGEIPVNAQKIGTDKYTTPTGKTVKVTKYSVTTPYGTSEEWTSDEVPFGDVKSISNGVVDLALYDFGFSGAVRGISRQEAENAKPFSFTGGGVNVGGQSGNQNGDGQPNVGGQGAGIKITIGAGTRPTISVSKPIKSLFFIGGDVLWGFNALDPPGELSGPFKYGVTPVGADAGGLNENPPDLVPGVVYQIQVLGKDFENGNIFDMGFLSFTR